MRVKIVYFQVDNCLVKRRIRNDTNVHASNAFQTVLKRVPSESWGVDVVLLMYN